MPVGLAFTVVGHPARSCKEISPHAIIVSTFA
jgi:hypothetical protein